MTAIPTRTDRAIAIALFSATFAALLWTAPSVGFPRDEGTYFAAGERTAAWVGDLFRSPVAALSDADIRSHWEWNHEHPGLAKLLFGLSHALFTDRLHWTNDATGFRLPAFAFAGLLSAMLYLLGLAHSRGAGFFAAFAFWLCPRHFFHGHLACFDVPITALWLATLYAYARSHASHAWAITTGLLFGCALAVKHNAYFLPPVLVLHFLVTARRVRWHPIPRAFVWMAVFGPLVLVATWPWLWHEGFARWRWYLGFHTTHVNYPWFYLGRLLREPPFPIVYPLVVTALATPLSIAVAMLLGALRWSVRTARGCATDLEHLLALNAALCLGLFMIRSTPIFGGLKHWMPGLAILCVLSGGVVVEAARAAWPSSPRAAALALGALVLVPGALGMRLSTYGTAYYGELAGGLPGAATLGMQRQFWSSHVTAVLPTLNATTPRGARVNFHEVTWDSSAYYKRDRLLRNDIQYWNDPSTADAVAYQWHREFRDAEFMAWNRFGERPIAGLWLDEVPQIALYARWK